MEIICKDIKGLPAAAEQFIKNIGGDSIFAFYGEMGAGKTTFISEVCRQLGCGDAVASPTFSIVNEYMDSEGVPVFHFDFYRLDSPQEAMDIGIDDYFASGFLCFMEWPEKIGRLLPAEAVKVLIEELPDGSRRISIGE